MSSVDERIVKMVFDNADFAQKVSSTIGSLTQLNKATNDVANNSGTGIAAMSKAFQQAEITATQAGFHIKDVWLKVASIFEYQIAGKIVNVSKQIANAMTFEGVSDGFKEYELKMGSIQTIMAGTGEKLATVNKYLDELNTYSDKTIYSFADMTNNIGKFTNAGVKLEDAVLAIKGIANEAAISGANANEASRAMYNFSQALSAGYVKLIDWKSIENANMATKGFKDTLLEVAASVGTVEKSADGMYKVLSTSAQGGSMKEAVSATKNFNDSLQFQWMTTEVLTKALKIYATDVRDLSTAEKEAFESELKAMGMSEEQIKNFEELGIKATDAASEIKTFTMLIDTLKEAIGSGWAMTWQLIIGDFEEAKELWTKVGAVLSKVIDDSSKARNELLEGWRALGGRDDLIQSLSNAFHALERVIVPIGEALKEVFPPIRAKQLADFTKGLKDLTSQFILTEEQSAKLKVAAKGVFSIFKIGTDIIKAFFKAFMPESNPLEGWGDKILNAAWKFGQFMNTLRESLEEARVFERFFEGLKDKLSPGFELITTVGSTAVKVVTSLFDAFSKAAGPTASVGEILKNVFSDISGGIDNLTEKLKKLSPLFDGIITLAKGIGSALGTIFKQIGESLSGFSNSGNGVTMLTTLINGALSGGILYKLFSGVKTFKSLGDSFSEVLEGLGGALNTFTEKVQAETLINVAKAIAILAGSLVVVAMVDSDKLAGATAAIGTMVGVMAGAMTVLMKAVNSFSTTDVTRTFSIFGKNIFGMNATKMIEMAVTLNSVSKALVSMGAAVLMMSVGLKVVSSAAEGGHLWDSFAVVSLMLGELTAVAIALGKWGGKATQGAKNLKGMGEALIILSAALAIVSKVVENGHAWQALGIITVMLAELTGITIAIERFGKRKLTGMTGLISMAVSLNLVVLALKTVSDALGNEGQHIWQALGIITIMLTELAAVTVVMSKFAGFAALGGAGAILAASSLLILVQALKQISDALGQTDQHIWQALGVIGVALVELAVGLTAMGATLPGAAGLLVASAALVVLGGALKIMGSLSLPEIGKALLVLAGSLTVLAVGLTAMIVALPGAAALIVAATGLTALAGALAIFGSMRLGDIVKALGLLVVSLAGIAVVTTVLSVASPFILAFSAALLVFGAAMAATGAGMTLFAAGLQALVAIIPVGVFALETLAKSMLNLLPILVEKLADAIGIFAAKIVEYAPVIGQAVVAIIVEILRVLGESAIQIGELISELMIKMINILAEKVPEWANAGANLMIAFMQAISKEIPRVVDEGYKCAIALVDGLANAIESNNGELIAAVDHLMTAAIQAIAQWLVEFTPLGLLIPSEMKEGIMSGEFNVKDALDKVIENAVATIKGFFEKFKQAAEYLIGGFIEGLKGTAVGKAVSAAADFGSKIIGGLNSKKGLDEHSPSKKGRTSGEFLAEGVIEGMASKEHEAVDFSAAMGGDIADALNDPLSLGVDDASKTMEQFSKALGSGEGAVKDFTGTAQNSESILDSIVGAFKDATAATKDNTVEIKKNEKSLKAHQTQQEKNSMRFQDDLKAEGKLTDEMKKNTEATDENTVAKEANATASGKSGKAAKSQADLMKEASGVVDVFTQKYGHLYTTLGEDGPIKVAEFAVRNLAEQLYKSSLTAEQATEKNKNTKASIEDMVKAFTDLKQKIYDSVESVFNSESFFMDQFEKKTELSMSQVLSNMRSHIDGVSEWANKLAELGEKGVNQGLLKYLTELGPKGYELVNAFSTATTGEIEQANVMFEQAAALPESISNSTLASYAKAGLNCIQGFANGIDNNVSIGSQSIETAASTYLKDFQEGLKEHSPSKATYDDGMNLILGLKNGMNNYSFEAHNKIVEITKDIVSVAEKNLDESIFFGFGENVGRGLADGMNASASAVRAAAEQLSAIAASVTTSYNGIHSPAKRYIGYGGNIAKGLAMGMLDGVSDVVSSATGLSEAIKNSIDAAVSIAEDDMEIRPVISPVLDLTNLRNSAGLVNSIFPSQSLALATAIGASAGSFGSSSDSQTNNSYTYGGANIYITARDGESADEIADKVINKLDRMTSRRKAVNGI